MRRAQDALAAYDEALAACAGRSAGMRGKASALLAAGRGAGGRGPGAAGRATGGRCRPGSACEQQATARAAAWAARAGTLLAVAETSRRDGHARAAVDGFVAAAAGYQQQGNLDAALDACQRALGVSLGAPAAHLQMARIYFQRGWADRGVERLLLLDRLLTLDEDPMTREGVLQLARTAPGLGADVWPPRAGGVA